MKNYPKVTITIPTCYEGNQRYLDLAIASIFNLNYPLDKIEVIVVASNGFTPRVPDSVNLIAVKERLHFAPAVNLGFKNASDDSEMFFIVSDDVVLTKNSLKNMVTQAADNSGIIGPISNCDNNIRFSLFFGFTKNEKGYHFPDRFYRYDTTSEFHKDMMNTDSVYPQGNILTEYFCFFCVLIPRKTWMAVGELDERFLSGQEDTDYCARTRKLGLPVFYCLDALVWHFGGVTAETMITDDIRKESLKRFGEKYSGAKFLNV